MLAIVSLFASTHAAEPSAALQAHLQGLCDLDGVSVRDAFPQSPLQLPMHSTEPVDPGLDDRVDLLRLIDLHQVLVLQEGQWRWAMRWQPTSDWPAFDPNETLPEKVGVAAPAQAAVSDVAPMLATLMEQGATVVVLTESDPRSPSAVGLTDQAQVESIKERLLTRVWTSEDASKTAARVWAETASSCWGAQAIGAGYWQSGPGGCRTFAEGVAMLAPEPFCDGVQLRAVFELFVQDGPRLGGFSLDSPLPEPVENVDWGAWAATLR